MVHAVFVDFSYSTQTFNIYLDHSNDDYSDCISAVLRGLPDTDNKWMELEDLWNREDMQREEWDMSSAYVISRETKIRCIPTVNPYACII